MLPLVQVICTQLYNRAKTRPDAMITLADLEAIGGVEGGMRANAESLVCRPFSHRVDQKAFERLLGSGTTQLYIRQPDGTLTTALLPAEYLGVAGRDGCLSSKYSEPPGTGTGVCCE